MRSAFLWLILALGSLAVVLGDQFIDSQGFNIEDVAELVCKTKSGFRYQLGHLSTVPKLIDYLKGVEQGHKHFDCRQAYLESLVELVQVFDTAPGDVCGDEKLAKMEEFHRKYISKVTKYIKQQRRSNKAPKLAKILFMRFASGVSSTCEEVALRALAKNQHTYSAEDIAKVEELRKFTDNLGMTALHKGYRGIYLFWNMVDQLDLARKEKFDEYLAEEGAPIRISLQIREAKPIAAIKALCEHQLKPIYGKTLMPVLRMIDMGYYPAGGRLANELNSPTSVHGLFFAAQICETLRPIGVFEDNSLLENQFVALTKSEASTLTLPKLEGLEELEAEPKPSLEVKPSPMIRGAMVKGDIVSIKDNVVHRSKIVNYMLRQLVRQTVSKLKSLFKGGKMFRKDKNKKREPVEDVNEDSFKAFQLEETTNDDDEAILDHQTRELVRNKRGFWKGFFEICSLIVYAYYWIIFGIIKLVVLPIPSLFFLPAFFSDNNARVSWASKKLKAMWGFGYI